MLQETDTALEIQWPDDVIEFSSQYGSEGSLSYCVKNLSQGVQTYPNYGDFTEAAVWVRIVMDDCCFAPLTNSHGNRVDQGTLAIFNGKKLSD